MKRILSILVAAAMVAAMIMTAGGSIEPAKLHDSNTLILWYADDSLTEYITGAAQAYQVETGVHVKPELVSGVELLGQINDSSVHEGEIRDQEECRFSPFRALQEGKDRGAVHQSL